MTRASSSSFIAHLLGGHRGGPQQGAQLGPRAVESRPHRARVHAHHDRDLAATLRVRPPTASKTISRLAALGFVERRAEAGDGRIVRVRLTEAGMAKAAAIERIWDEVEAELLEGFDNKERRRLRKLLRKVARSLAEAAGVTGHEEADHEMDGEADEEEEILLGPGASDAVARS